MKLVYFSLAAPLLAKPTGEGDDLEHDSGLLPPVTSDMVAEAMAVVDRIPDNTITVSDPQPIYNPSYTHGNFGFWDENGIWRPYSNSNMVQIGGKWYSPIDIGTPPVVEQPKPVTVVNDFWYKEPITPPKPAPVVYNNAPMDPLMLMLLLDNDNNNNNNNDLLLPLFLQQNNQGAGPNQPMNNPLMLMALLNDDDKTCAQKYPQYATVAEQADANPTIDFTVAQNALAAADFDKIDFQYIGCLEHEAAKNADTNDDLLLPLMLQSMGGVGTMGANMNTDLTMLMLLSNNNAFGGNLKKYLPFLASNGINRNNVGGFDPLTLVMLMEEAACEIKYDIPTFYYANDAVANTLTKIVDKTQVKTFYENKYATYKTCNAAATSDDSNDIIFWMMMMGMPMQAGQ